jgi:tetratricopeptide (TPR) repeat protein
MRALLVAFVVFAATPLAACINTFGTDLRGQQREALGLVGEELRDYLVEHPGRWHWRLERAKLAWADETIEQQNDYAVTLIHLGDLDEAIAILQKIERKKPGLYHTATNLGTAYELAGDNARAVQWIREGIRRNPDSHRGSEWLHVAILEAKRAKKTHSILGLDFGTAVVPKLPARYPSGNDGKPLDAARTSESLQAQLHERLAFVAAPDALVGDLLFDYANLLMLVDVVESGAAMYELALEYGTPRAALAKQRLAHARKILR